jgi:ankyrin repeat protein
VTEEISKSGYYWTVLHYASHYGHYEVLNFLIEFLEDHPRKMDIFNMQTTEGKTPLFCAILSGDIQIPVKQRIIKLWFDTNCIDLNLRKQSGEDLLQLAQKNKLYEFIVEYCLRED